MDFVSDQLYNGKKFKSLTLIDILKTSRGLLMRKLINSMDRKMIIFFCITAMLGLAMGLSDSFLSNYFKDAYNVSTATRGIIEFPRELPGLLCLVVIGAGSFLGDIRLAIIAQLLSIIGLVALGLLTPPFNIMLIFLFINSLGNHMYMPLDSSIGMSLVEDQRQLGKRLGQYSSVRTAFGMIAFIIMYFGAQAGWFSFTTTLKIPFLISAALFIIILVLFIVLKNTMAHEPITERKFKLVFKKQYKLYYVLATVFGVQKQIMLVYGPWVLLRLLNLDLSTMALLYMVGSFVGVFFLPLLGKWLDRFGIRKLLFADALSFIGVYVLYAFFSAGFNSGFLATTGIALMLTFGLFIIDRMSTQMGLVRVAYLRKIIVDSRDLTPTLSTGTSMDHVVSIVAAILCGFIWESFGPQYVFIFAALMSLVNLFVAFKVHDSDEEARVTSRQQVQDSQ